MTMLRFSLFSFNPLMSIHHHSFVRLTRSSLEAAPVLWTIQQVIECLQDLFPCIIRCTTALHPLSHQPATPSFPTNYNPSIQKHTPRCGSTIRTPFPMLRPLNVIQVSTRGLPHYGVSIQQWQTTPVRCRRTLTLRPVRRSTTECPAKMSVTVSTRSCNRPRDLPSGLSQVKSFLNCSAFWWKMIPWSHVKLFFSLTCWSKRAAKVGRKSFEIATYVLFSPSFGFHVHRRFIGFSWFTPFSKHSRKRWATVKSLMPWRISSTLCHSSKKACGRCSNAVESHV